MPTALTIGTADHRRRIHGHNQRALICRAIAFSSTTDVDGNAEIYVMNADGTGVTQLTTATTGLVANITSTWSPDPDEDRLRQ